MAETKETAKAGGGCCGSGCASCPNRRGEAEGAACSKGEGASPCATCGGCGEVRMKLHSFNYLEDIPGGFADDDMVEVQFKNTRKGFYLNSGNIPLKIGDWVAVEAAPGHDIGRVSMTGALVRLQMRKANVKPNAETRRVFRRAKASDMERYRMAKDRENETMIRSRQIAADLKLNMKIGDVEYQGDGNKAIFYYIADERVDFRQLIKVLAEKFKVRIEMKQIGARQEAGRIGGIGPCGRPLCCNTWMTNFVSVSTSAARYQDISLNPQKLAGQCAKLKCCLNFEIDSYIEASKKLPPKDTRLETADATYFYFKADIFKREITYSTDKNVPANLVTLSAERAFEVIAMNKAGEKPLKLAEEVEAGEKAPSEYGDIIGQDSLTRFDSKKKKRKKKGGAPAAQKEGPKPDQQKGGGEKPKGPRPEGQKPQKPKGEKPQGEKPQGEKPQGEARPGGQDRQGRNRPKKHKPQGQKPDGQKPEGGKSNHPNASQPQ